MRSIPTGYCSIDGMFVITSREDMEAYEALLQKEIFDWEQEEFHFEDYNADELFQIACNLLKREEYRMTPETEAYLKETILEAVAEKDAFFHNARWVEQYMWDGVIAAMSDRVMSMPLKLESRELFQTIELQDVQVAFQKMKPLPSVAPVQRKRIGFVA